MRRLTLDRDQTIKNTMRQVEDLSKELANALRAVASAESRAAVAEVNVLDCTHLYALFLTNCCID